MQALTSPGGWIPEEDAMLIRLVQENGTRDWTSHATQLQKTVSKDPKNGKQCRERWHNQLRPDIKTEPFSDEEQAQLVEAHREYGNKWSLIVEKGMPERTENQIKNFMNASVRMREMLLRMKGEESSRKAMHKCLKQRSAHFLKYIFSLDPVPKKEPSSSDRSDKPGKGGAIDQKALTRLLNMLVLEGKPQDQPDPRSSSGSAENSDAPGGRQGGKRSRAHEMLQLNLDMPLASDCDITAPANRTLDSVFGSMRHDIQSSKNNLSHSASGGVPLQSRSSRGYNNNIGWVFQMDGINGGRGAVDHAATVDCLGMMGAMDGIHGLADVTQTVDTWHNSNNDREDRLFRSVPVDMHNIFEMGDKRQRSGYGAQVRTSQDALLSSDNLQPIKSEYADYLVRPGNHSSDTLQGLNSTAWTNQTNVSDTSLYAMQNSLTKHSYQGVRTNKNTLNSMLELHVPESHDERNVWGDFDDADVMKSQRVADSTLHAATDPQTYGSLSDAHTSMFDSRTSDYRSPGLANVNIDFQHLLADHQETLSNSVLSPQESRSRYTSAYPSRSRNATDVSNLAYPSAYPSRSYTQHTDADNFNRSHQSTTSLSSQAENAWTSKALVPHDQHRPPPSAVRPVTHAPWHMPSMQRSDIHQALGTCEDSTPAWDMRQELLQCMPNRKPADSGGARNGQFDSMLCALHGLEQDPH